MHEIGLSQVQRNKNSSGVAIRHEDCRVDFVAGAPPASLLRRAHGCTFSLIGPAGLALSPRHRASSSGVVKGTVGFAMPMIMISGLASSCRPQLALAGLILPTLADERLAGAAAGAAGSRASVEAVPALS